MLHGVASACWKGVCLGRRRAEQCACAGATAEVRRRMASYGDGRRRTATPIGPDPRVLWVSSIFSVVPSLDANSSCVLFPPSGVLEPPPSVFCQDSCDPAPLRCQMSLRSPIFPSLHFSWLAREFPGYGRKIQTSIGKPRRYPSPRRVVLPSVQRSRFQLPGTWKRQYRD
ncbi:uncharacterized protein [Dendrobates tinctorius]|uniref:uncharacterized protein isoform X3 n=1 Tax=Dendrobates tinctorius TaxID=92724 RepID=UPI003CC92B70